MIGNVLVLIGILIIFIGFLILMLGTVLGTRPNTEWEKSKRRDPFEKESYSKRTSDFERTRDGNSPERKSESRIKGGGVIMLGPIPIIFGSDGDSAKTAAILAIFLMFLALIMFRGTLS
ncbi:DUF131 domain-containing protein [Methanosarcina sp. KYL-1]|uniref:TIGR00304 family membrane protein n=1 Tax=Methanosarcina sp. KYL-1 TaxID=2602068 RepID=UPI002100EBC7|nr:DUF131 domain-containing protein [Methanosarcina sp. KYL-1]MCQ1534340.1 DUF131 domain-containing protein [Methanosarcina sp. KYL-1]